MVLSKYIARGGTKGSVLSSRQAMKAAIKGRTVITNSARARPLIRAANGFRYVSKGLIALDVGFRIYNVYNSNNMGRTATSELFGFGASSAVGWAGGSLAVALSLGPLGWIIAIIVIGLTVVAVDYLGKRFGESIYDSGASMYTNMMTLSY